MEHKDLTLFQQIIDERFKGLHIQMDTEFKLVNQHLSQIKEQTTRTNSRVTHLEEDVKNLRERDLTHILRCPQIPVIKELSDEVYSIEKEQNDKLEQIKEDLAEYRLIKKYPKIGLGVIAITCIALVISTMLILARLNNEVKAQTYKATVEQPKK